MSRDLPPMPVRADVYGTVRHDDTVVARMIFTDVMGDARTLDLQVDTALALAADLIAFVRQVQTRVTPPGEGNPDSHEWLGMDR